MFHFISLSRMLPSRFLRSRIVLPRILAAVTLLTGAFSAACLLADGTQVSFDLPDAIECRDVTPKDFVQAHPTLKVIEAKLRISARLTQGNENAIVDFRYLITSPGKNLTFQDFPGNTLQSTVADDHIEITNSKENSTGGTADGHLTAEHILTLGGTKNQSSKTTEQSHYKQIAPKTLVLATGTTDREHGVFFKLRPSPDQSLEGAKEFTFRATVPKTWRGDWCTVSCCARATKKSYFSSVVAHAGGEMTDIGLYLGGDAEANDLAKELRSAQDDYAAALTRQNAEGEDSLEKMLGAVSRESKSVFGIFKSRKPASDHSDEIDKADHERSSPEEAEKAVRDVKERLGRLAK